MDQIKKEIQNDILLIQLLVQPVLYMVFQNVQVNMGFLAGSLISLGNFNLMVTNARGMARSPEGETPAGAKRALGSFGVRYALMAATVFFALSLSKFNIYALLVGLFCVQFALFGREIFKRTVSTVLR